MSICVFVGPTLRREEVAGACDAVCLPPVAQGDVYRAALQKPRAIGIIDGYFSGAPSVWHKEILWALSEGIEVFGSASMGALRAAELHAFGMRGVGRIFEAFRDGILEDDDEVAVVHGPAETGYVSASEPMVNIRATLEQAENVGIFSAASRVVLESYAKSLFFPDRNWVATLNGAREKGVPEQELEAFSNWLPEGRVDQKRADALAMLAAIEDTAQRPKSDRGRFRFEWTHFWDELVARTPAARAVSEPSRPSLGQRIIDELRLEGERPYKPVKTGALLRLISGREAMRRGLPMSLDKKQAALNQMRAALGLFSRADLDAWMVRNHLDAASLERLITENARSQEMTDVSGPSFDQQLLDALRLNGDYERLAERAERKQAVVSAHGTADAGKALYGPNSAALRLWFFERHLRLPAPDDIEAYSRALGFTDLVHFDSTLRNEWLYSSLERTEDSVA